MAPNNKSEAIGATAAEAAASDNDRQHQPPADSAELVHRRVGTGGNEVSAAEVAAAKLVTTKKIDPADLPIVWKNVILFIYLHLGALYGLYLCFYCKGATVVFGVLGMFFAALGVTAGAHRLWAHRTYKAKLPLRIFLAFCQTLAGQNSIYEWSRDHRVHHKHSETDADPHNVKRGFFFAHMGWLLKKKHPDVIQKGARIPLDDLLADPVVYYQKKYYLWMAFFVIAIFPTVVPMYFWGESFKNAYYVSTMLRYALELHFTWLVNSAAHLWGNKPYDKRINPVENWFVTFFSIGEGFHNYHHTFPQDYAASEFGLKKWNLSKGFIDLMALIGQAYDRTKISPEAVMARRKRTGDLSSIGLDDCYHDHHHDFDENFEHPY